MSKVKKSAQVVKEPAGAEDMAQINRFTLEELTAEQVFTFAVRLCDNQIDRDQERFPRKTLEELARLFVGKSGIFDHSWTARGQAARIYRAEVVDEAGQKTAAGDDACYLRGYAYMLRTESNQDLIAEIEGGIKKEVSVGCAVGQVACSICGKDLGACGHRKGQVYEGKRCWGELLHASDAYEWSFVAVPAQPAAGVTKSCGVDLAAPDGDRWAMTRIRVLRAKNRMLALRVSNALEPEYNNTTDETEESVHE